MTSAARRRRSTGQPAAAWDLPRQTRNGGLCLTDYVLPSDHVALFEIARIYLPSGEQLPNEHWRVAGVVMGGYEVVKGVLETLYGALGLDLRVARGSHALLHPGKAAKTDAG